MPTAKTTWFFAQGSNGWSMSLWKNFAAGQLDRVQGSGVAIAPVIAAMTGQNTFIVGVRSSDESVTGDSIIQLQSFKGAAQEQSEDPNTSVTIKMQTNDRARKKNIFMRGIWDSLIIGGGVIDVNNAPWVNAFNTFKAIVFRDGWGWVGKTSSTTANITAYVVDAQGVVSFTLDGPVFAPADINQRRSVRISGLNNSKSILNGQQIVIATAPNAMKSVRAFGAGPFEAIGRVRYNMKDLIIPTIIEVFRVGERRVGAPFFHQRGRRQNRATR